MIVRMNDNVSRKRLESLAIGLNYGDGDVTCFAGVDVSHDSRFAFVCSADDKALIAVFGFVIGFPSHGVIEGTGARK